MFALPVPFQVFGPKERLVAVMAAVRTGRGVFVDALVLPGGVSLVVSYKTWGSRPYVSSLGLANDLSHSCSWHAYFNCRGG